MEILQSLLRGVAIFVVFVTFAPLLIALAIKWVAFVFKKLL